jgi:hypothetical protein
MDKLGVVLIKRGCIDLSESSKGEELVDYGKIVDLVGKNKVANLL